MPVSQATIKQAIWKHKGRCWHPIAPPNGWTYEVLQDLGSGLNYHKRGLQLLIKRICSGDVGRLVLAHQDRLLRFGSE